MWTKSKQESAQQLSNGCATNSRIDIESLTALDDKPSVSETEQKILKQIKAVRCGQMNPDVCDVVWNKTNNEFDENKNQWMNTSPE